MIIIISNRRRPYDLLVAIFAVFCITASSAVAVESSQNIDGALPETKKKQTVLNRKSLSFASWEACISAAELLRSERDFKFFMSASNLSDSKPWFVSHSRANEALFCVDVGRCDQAFERKYSAADGGYPPC